MHAAMVCVDVATVIDTLVELLSVTVLFVIVVFVAVVPVVLLVVAV